MLTKSQGLVTTITGLRSLTTLSDNLKTSLTKTEANLLLDWHKAGKEVPRELVDMALILTGDLCPKTLL
jgi:hypothetical protein